jgi:hypothetical protein
MSTLAVNSVTDANGGNTATINSMTPTADSLQGFRNRIINGDMRIDQRNAGASVTPSNENYTLDRWQAWLSQSAKYSVQQNAGSVTPPAGFTNYLGVTSLSAYSLAASDYFFISQKIEGFNFSDLAWGTINAQAVTLSFRVRSSLTGTFGGSIQNSAQNRSYPFTYTISAANTWETKTVTIPGETTGTWLTTNGLGAYIWFGLGVGSNLSGTANSWDSSAKFSVTGATSVVATNGATFYLTGVQLEVGSVATPFERRPYGTELSLCQRYFQKYTGMLLSGYAASGAAYYNTFLFPVELRATPTIIYSNFTNSNSNNAITNSVGTKVWRTQANMTVLGGGFSVFNAETSGAEL